MLQPDSAMGPALQAAYLMMEALGGKLLLFQTSVPNVGVGKITQRDNPTLYNTDSEHRLRVPEDIFFKKFAAEASKAQISIDVFSFRYSTGCGCRIISRMWAVCLQWRSSSASWSLHFVASSYMPFDDAHLMGTQSLQVG